MKKITFSKKISWQKVPNENILYVYNINTRKYYIFSDTEIYVWELIDKYKKITTQDIIDSCVNHYDVDKDILNVDINEFIDDLLSIGVLEYEEGV